MNVPEKNITSKIKFLFVLIIAGLALSGFRYMHNKQKNKMDESCSAVPEWAREAIWYQIFVERFRNGDTGNDPTPEDMNGSFPDKLPSGWTITPWGHDWYSHEPWLDEVQADGFYSKIQARRYGGDLQGVLDKIDYIASLGVTAVYFNPLNDSPSLHKYDARTYTHIDRNSGPDPKGDAAIINSENHDDPSSWKWTSADKLFLKVVSEFHKKGIRVIIDYSWNHTGKDFWALNDIRKNGKKSKYSDWYTITRYDDPATSEDEMQYKGWGGNNPYMPVFRKDIIPPGNTTMPIEGNLHSRSLKQHIFSVTRRWLDPDGDGNPSDGVDGFRLDVAGEIPMGFWRDYRKLVRSVNPEAYLIGEIWGFDWPDKKRGVEIYLQGDQFDALMNYRWYRVARGFFGQAEPVLLPSGFVKGINSINKDINTENLQAMMNVPSTHDTPRLSTSLFNKTMDKYREKPSENPNYKIFRPDLLTRKEQMLLLVHQFTFIGAPQIWYGEEVGMWGANDPDCRKPMIWDDLTYDIEKTAYNPAESRPADTVKPDLELKEFYTRLCNMRKQNPALTYGNLSFTIADDRNMILAYNRAKDNDEISVVFNRSESFRIVDLPVEGDAYFDDILSIKKTSYLSSHNKIRIKLDPLSAVVLKKRTER